MYYWLVAGAMHVFGDEVLMIPNLFPEKWLA
jgi:hypothetical protein